MKFSILVVLLVLGSSVRAQRIVPDSVGLFRSASVEAEWQGDSLLLRFAGQLTGRLKSSQALRVEPLYISGRDSLRFPTMGCYSPAGAKYRIRRNTFLDGEKENERMCVIRNVRDSVDYCESVTVAPGGKGELLLLYVLSDCCSSEPVGCERISVPERVGGYVEREVLPLPVAAVSVPLFEANVTFVKPEQEPVKERTATMSVYLTYPVNHWKIDPDFEGNAAELERVDRFFSPVATDTVTYGVLSVSITGYASVEGAWIYNMTLSGKRAGGMRDYLCRRYGVSARKIGIEGRGEDWDGLRKAVEMSKIPERGEILRIIDSYNVSDGREKRLMELSHGEPYHYMMQNIFPSLRRMEAEIRYRVRSFGAEEAEKLIRHRPQDLSLCEMYEAARVGNSDRTIKQGRDGYGREYDIAVRYFPDDDIANINAASAALVRGDLDEAWLYLNRVKNNPKAANNLGVYFWLCNRIAEAEAAFERAMKTDPERAAYNLEQLAKWKEEFGKKEDMK